MIRVHALSNLRVRVTLDHTAVALTALGARAPPPPPSLIDSASQQTTSPTLADLVARLLASEHGVMQDLQVFAAQFGGRVTQEEEQRVAHAHAGRAREGGGKGTKETLVRARGRGQVCALGDMAPLERVTRVLCASKATVRDTSCCAERTRPKQRACERPTNSPHKTAEQGPLRTVVSSPTNPPREHARSGATCPSVTTQ